MIKELLRGLKWVALALIALVVIVGIWIGCAWAIGASVNRFMQINFENQNYIVLGSVILAFVLVAQVVTVILTGWVLISWNKSRKK